MTGSTNNIGELSGDLVARITAKLLELLRSVTSDQPEVGERLAGLLPALVELAVSEGQEVANDVLAGLASDDAKDVWDAWEKLITAASPEKRIGIMESSRRAAIAETLRKIKRESDQWEILKNIIAVLVIVVPLLL